MLRRLFSIASTLLLLLWLTCAGVWVWAAARGGWGRFYFVAEQHKVIGLGIRGDHAWMETATWIGSPPPQHWVNVTPRYQHWQFAGIWVDSGMADVDYPTVGVSTGPYGNYGTTVWLPMIVTGVIPLSWYLLVLRPWMMCRRRIRRGQCPACGYDLRASSDRCPECGARNTRYAGAH